MVVQLHLRSGATDEAEGSRRRSEAEGSTPADRSGFTTVPPPLAVTDLPRNEAGAPAPFRAGGSTPAGGRKRKVKATTDAERLFILFSFLFNCEKHTLPARFSRFFLFQIPLVHTFHSFIHF
jgi:hypothetical protein